MAHSLGLTVFGTAGTDDGMAMVKKQGADHVYNHRNKGYEKEVLVGQAGQILATPNIARRPPVARV